MARLRVRDVDLNVEVSGRGSPLLLLHGFTGSVDEWEPHLPALRVAHTVIRVDALGHGKSDAPDDAWRYGMTEVVDDLATVLAALRVRRAHVLGYSMGARTALQFAVAHGDRLVSLVLESGSPGLATDHEREERLRADEVLAVGIERDGVSAFVDRWETQPLFASQRRLPAPVQEAVRARRLLNRAHGLAQSLRGAGTGAQTSLWDRIASLDVPTLLVAGGDDAKYCAIARAMADLMPAAEVVIVSGAGHNVHVEQPEGYDHIISEFLARHERRCDGEGARACL